MGLGLIGAVGMRGFGAKSCPRGVSGISAGIKEIEDVAVPGVGVRTEDSTIDREGNEVGFRVVIISATVKGKVTVTVIPIFLTLNSREFCG